MDLLSLRPSQLAKARQAALMRLQLWTIGKIDQDFLDFGRDAKAIIMDITGKEGNLDDGLKAYRLQIDLLKLWGDTFSGFIKTLEKARQEAALLPFGVMAINHEKFVRPAMVKKLGESTEDFVFKPQLRSILQAADDWMSAGGSKLSTNLWDLDRETRDAINRTIMDGVTEGRSAWDIAKNLEQFLGADGELPRWTSARLYGLTKAQIASGNMTGLIKDTAGSAKGVSYKALRIARTELQRVHHMANDQTMANMPWVEKEQIVLSSGHAEEDECDDVIRDGEDGHGIYPKGTISLPIHPNCLCDKAAVQDLEAFGEKLSEWSRTGQGFPAMDDYADYLGADLSGSLMTSAAAMALSAWIDGSQREINIRMSGAGSVDIDMGDLEADDPTRKAIKKIYQAERP